MPRTGVLKRLTMDAILKWTWTIEQKGPLEFYVDEKSNTTANVTRYGPMAARSTANALIEERRAMIDKFLARAALDQIDRESRPIINSRRTPETK
jgi:4'-phosphopantetheinyl transferase EntD